MDRLYTTGNHTENGYKAVIFSEKWRVAYMNNTTETLSPIKYMERHTTSDELFILLSGRCRLLLSEKGTKDVKIVEMEKDIMYNIPNTTFHLNVMDPGTHMLIVENLDVSEENTEYDHFTADEIEKYREILSEK